MAENSLAIILLENCLSTTLKFVGFFNYTEIHIILSKTLKFI